jgi:hypothetical protein
MPKPIDRLCRNLRARDLQLVRGTEVLVRRASRIVGVDGAANEVLTMYSQLLTAPLPSIPELLERMTFT